MARREKEEAGQCNYRKEVLKKPISSSNEVGFPAVVAVSGGDRRWYEQTRGRCQSSRAKGGRNSKCVSGEPFQTCGLPDHKP